MNRTTLNILNVALALAILTGAAIAAGTPAAQPEKKEQIKKERYDALVDHNIFLKERGRRMPSTSYSNNYNSRNSQPTRVPEASFVLTGVVIEEGQYRAYVEDVANGHVLRLAVGDPVARGHVADIDIDAIAYVSGRQGLWINVGSDLRGQAFNSFSSRYTSSGSSGSGASTSPSSSGVAVSPLPIDPNAPNLTTEERMRLRRQQGK